MQRRRKQNDTALSELEGPEDPILTPPPTRRVGLIVAGSLVLLAVLGIFGVLVARPLVVVNTVEAFF